MERVSLGKTPPRNPSFRSNINIFFYFQHTRITFTTWVARLDRLKPYLYTRRTSFYLIAQRARYIIWVGWGSCSASFRCKAPRGCWGDFRQIVLESPNVRQ